MVKNSTSTVTVKGQVTIPIEVRKALGLKPRDRVTFVLENGVVRIQPYKSKLEAGFGAVKTKGKLVDFKQLRREALEEAAQRILEEI